MKTIIHFILITLLGCSLYACEKTGISTSPVSNTLNLNDPNVAEAKVWFEQAEKKVTGARVGAAIGPQRKEAEWAKGKSFKRGKATIVEVPLPYNGPMLARKRKQVENQAAPTYIKKEYESLELKTELIAIKDEKGNWRSYILKVMGSPFYYLGQNTKSLDGNDLEQIKDTFSGSFLFYDLNENLLGGISYQFGQAIGNLIPMKKAPGARQYAICTTTYIDHYSQACFSGSCGDPTLIYSENLGQTCEYYNDDTYGGTGGSGGDSGGTGSNPGQGQTTNQTYDFSGYYEPTINVDSYLRCFGTNQYTDAANYKYSVTVYVQEPNTGSGSSSWFGNVGHACIGITKENRNDSNDKKLQVIGFYPADKLGCSFYPVAPLIKDNGAGSESDRLHYTVSVNYPDLNAGQFSRVLYGISAYQDASYQLARFNCTTFVITIIDFAGLSIPKTISPVGTGDGYSPGQLGLGLRNWNNSNVNRTAGVTPQSKGSCN